jgi:hypothetical protein
MNKIRDKNRDNTRDINETQKIIQEYFKIYTPEN